MQNVLRVLQPASLVALLATLILLFGFQGEQILDQPIVIALLAVPILIQVYFNSGLAYLLNRLSGEQHCVAGPSALIGASNFFELAVAAAISLFGFHSGAALATVVGVLIEVPVMLSVVKIVTGSKRWYERGARCPQAVGHHNHFRTDAPVTIKGRRTSVCRPSHFDIVGRSYRQSARSMIMTASALLRPRAATLTSSRLKSPQLETTSDTFEPATTGYS